MSISAISSTYATRGYSYRVHPTAQTYARTAERQAGAIQMLESSKRREDSDDNGRKNSTLTATTALADQTRANARAVSSYTASGATTRIRSIAAGRTVDLVA